MVGGDHELGHRGDVLCCDAAAVIVDSGFCEAISTEVPAGWELVAQVGREVVVVQIKQGMCAGGCFAII